MPWLSKRWINLWMLTRDSQLVRYCHSYVIMVATSTCCSSSCSNPKTERPGKVDSCLILVSTVAAPKAHQYLPGSLKYPLLRWSKTKDTWRRWAITIGCFWHLSPVRLTSASNTDNWWHPPLTPQIQMGPSPSCPDGIMVHFASVCTKALYPCGSNMPGHWIHTVH